MGAGLAGGVFWRPFSRRRLFGMIGRNIRPGRSTRPRAHNFPCYASLDYSLERTAGLAWIEGPERLLAANIGRDEVWKYDILAVPPKQSRMVRLETYGDATAAIANPGPAGLLPSAGGGLIVAEGGNRRLSLIRAGSLIAEPLATRFGSRRLNGPNSAVFGTGCACISPIPGISSRRGPRQELWPRLQRDLPAGPGRRLKPGEQGAEPTNRDRIFLRDSPPLRCQWRPRSVVVAGDFPGCRRKSESQQRFRGPDKTERKLGGTARASAH